MRALNNSRGTRQSILCLFVAISSQSWLLLLLRCPG